MPKWRKYVLAVVLWIYGISITVTLVSVWGRALVVDSELMASTAAIAADSSLVSGRIQSWLQGELASVPGIGPEAAEGAAETLMADPDVSATIDALVVSVFEAATAPVGESTVVDVGQVLRPAASSLAGSLQAQGIPATEDQVAERLAELEPLVVRDPSEPPPVGRGSNAAATLSLATALGLAIALATGWAAVWMSEDRRLMVRSLFMRIATSALGFAVMFRLGSWILDPGAGRSPARTAAAELAGSKLWIPILISVLAGAAATIPRVKRSLRPEAETST